MREYYFLEVQLPLIYILPFQQNINWSKVKIGLVDERFVNNDSEFSNEKLIRKNLCKIE